MNTEQKQEEASTVQASIPTLSQLLKKDSSKVTSLNDADKKIDTTIPEKVIASKDPSDKHNPSSSKYSSSNKK